MKVWFGPAPIPDEYVKNSAIMSNHIKSNQEWIHTKDVSEFADLIKHSDFHIERCMKYAHEAFLNKNYAGRNRAYQHANNWDIEFIMMPYDKESYVELKKWLDTHDKKFPIKFYGMTDEETVTALERMA